MQIQLKQVEIVEALKQFLTKQGIDLVGKTVAISFTAGRKEAGLSADIHIDEVEIPGLEEASTEDTARSVTSVVQLVPSAIVAMTPDMPTAATSPASTVAAEKPPTSSLFG